MMMIFSCPMYVALTANICSLLRLLTALCSTSNPQTIQQCTIQSNIVQDLTILYNIALHYTILNYVYNMCTIACGVQYLGNNSTKSPPSYWQCSVLLQPPRQHNICTIEYTILYNSVHYCAILYKNVICLQYFCVEYIVVRFPDPTYGVGRENEPLRSWEKNFGVTKLKKFQWWSSKADAYWKTAYVERLLMLVSLTHLHRLPGKKRF